MGHGDFIQGPKADYGATRALCESCTVREECLEAAVAHKSIVGSWGASTEKERRAMRWSV